MSAKHPDIAKRIKAAMTERGFKTAAALAGAMKVEESRVRNWQNGHGRPTVDQGIAIKHALGITLDWLYEGDPDGVPYGLYIRLAARESGQPVPVLSEDEPAEALELDAASKVERRPSKAKQASGKLRSQS